ncbi:MAG TPA: Na(+)/H(+) antiporter subunit B, partial [Verrucomicrobiota bacterium]|nr:Na(+)/H(+) antiporter subunit B [Verrucomicrobiota bacterium]
LAVALAAAVRALPWQATGLAGAAHDRLAESGVTNPVTAVLLNFRAYDTLLEIGVLLLALAAVWAVARPRRADEAEDPDREPARPQQRALVHLLVPVMILTAGYLLWIGAKAPGGAFQAGAVLGGAGVLLVLTRPGWAALRDRAPLRALLAAGLAVFLGVGLLMLGRGGRLLEYPEGSAGAWILLIEAAATVSIGLTLTLLFVGARPAAGKEARP